jgi:hypothetical protein
MQPLFRGQFFFFCASVADTGTATPHRGVPHLDAVVRHGGGLLSKLPTAHPTTFEDFPLHPHDVSVGGSSALILAVGTPSECFRVREILRQSAAEDVSSRVIFVRPAYIEDCVKSNSSLPVDAYKVFRRGTSPRCTPRSSAAIRGPAADRDFESLELTVAIEMHRVARELQDEIAWRKRSTGSHQDVPKPRASWSRSSSVASAAPQHQWFGDVDAKLARVIQQGVDVVQEQNRTDLYD